MRTISSIESMNAQLGCSFQKHPHTFQFIDCLKLFEFAKTLEMPKLLQETRGQLERKNKSNKERDEKIKIFTEMLQNGRINELEFLEAMGYRVILPSSGMLFVSIFFFASWYRMWCMFDFTAFLEPTECSSVPIRKEKKNAIKGIYVEEVKE